MVATPETGTRRNVAVVVVVVVVAVVAVVVAVVVVVVVVAVVVAAFAVVAVASARTCVGTCSSASSLFVAFPDRVRNYGLFLTESWDEYNGVVTPDSSVLLILPFLLDL